MIVIHFSEFEDMISELASGKINPVRIGIEHRIAVAFTDMPDAAIMEVLVRVCQVQGQEVLSWAMPLGQYEAVRGAPMGSDDQKVYDGAIKSARQIVELIEGRLLDQDHTFDIRGGMVDINGRYTYGKWEYLDIESVVIGEAGGDGEENLPDNGSQE